jgi:hypothetical protein
MSTLIVRAREVSLALLIVAVVEHGCLLGGDYSGAAPSSSGLIRLGRDLMRRAGGVPSDRSRAEMCTGAVGDTAVQRHVQRAGNVSHARVRAVRMP